MDCVWVDNWLYDTNHYNETTEEWWVDEATRWGNASFHRRTGEMLNLAVNSIADALHNIYVQSGIADIGDANENNENGFMLGVYSFAAFGMLLATGFFVYFRYVYKKD